MENIFRSLSFNIVQAVYPLIPDLYGIIIDIGSNQYFTAEAIQKLSSNIYLVISVCMLFALGISLISAIVNPDLFSDKKKGVKSVALRSVAAIFLIILIPMGFNKLYEVQSDVVKNQLVEKIVLGMDPNVSNDPGQILAAYGFASFCEPHETVSSQALSSQGADLYNKALTEDISYIKQMDGVINSKTNGEYDLEYNAIIAPAVGIYLLYQMIIIAIDIALRTIKLGMLQLIAPIILCGYVIAGTDILQKWFKMVMSTFVLLFLKMAMIAFMIFGLSLLPDFLENFSSKSFWYRGFLRMFIIIGLLQLIKQIPEIINNIFGANIKDRGGIRGRLGEMAGVGALAQRGWDQHRQHPIQTAQTLVSAPLSAVGGGLAHNVAAINRARGQWTNGNRRAAIGTVLGGLLGTGGAAMRGGRMGWQNRNLQGIGAQGHRYEDTHVGDSTLNGRVQDSILSGLGLRTRQEQQEQRDRLVNYNGNRYTVDQLNNMRSQHDAVMQRRNAIRDAAVDAITADDSNLRMNVTGLGTGNYNQLLHQLEGMRNAPLQQRAGETDVQFQQRVADHQQRINDLENDLMLARNNTRDALIEYAMSHGGEFERRDENNHIIHSINGETVNGVNINAIDATQNAVSARDRGIIQTNYNTINDMGIGDIHSLQALNDANAEAQNNLNAIDTALQSHQQRVYDRQNSEEGRERADSNTSVQNRNNGGSNNGGGGNGH